MKTKEFIKKNNIQKGTLLRRKKDNVVIELTGKILETCVGFNDVGNGDKCNYLAEYTVIDSPYGFSSAIHIYNGGKYSGSCNVMDRFNPMGLGASFFFSLTRLTFMNKWEIIK
jgi:hypothetical protein